MPGQARGTIEAKRRDLSRFLAFYVKLYGHDRPEEWYASVTREFVRQMAKDRYIWRYVKPDVQNLADAVDELA